MKVGTRSLLFGVHQVVWHPITVLIAWNVLYGAPTFKEFICIFIHDWGYLGCKNMDGKEGINHPELAGKLVSRWGSKYSDLCFGHSRTYAKLHNLVPSKLCWADKLSIKYDPCWFYLLRATLSGEIKEYRLEADRNKVCPLSASNTEWFSIITVYMNDYAKFLEVQGLAPNT